MAALFKIANHDKQPNAINSKLINCGVVMKHTLHNTDN